MKFFLLPCIALLSALASTAPALAQIDDTVIELTRKDNNPAKKDRPPAGPITHIRPAALLFAGFDSNADYLISETELMVGRTTAFNAADADGSGSLNIFELEDWRTRALGSVDAIPGAMAFDPDLNRVTTRAEFDDTLTGIFSRADIDGDGVLALSDMVQVYIMPERDERQSRYRDRVGPPDPIQRRQRRR